MPLELTIVFLGQLSYLGQTSVITYFYSFAASDSLVRDSQI